MTTFNVNDYATVRLTPYGRQVLDKYIDGELAGLTRHFLRTCPESWRAEVEKMATHFQQQYAVAEDGSFTDQFWQIAHIFRGEFHMGSPGVFENGEIQIERKP